MPAAYYGLLAEMTGGDPGPDRLRPPGRGVPPLPAGRPRPWRLGPDDDPALAVRHGQRGPARGPGRLDAPAARPTSSSRFAGKRPTTCSTARPGSSAWPAVRASPAGVSLEALELVGPDAPSVLAPLPVESDPARGGGPARAGDRAHRALVGADRAGPRPARTGACRRPLRPPSIPADRPIRARACVQPLWTEFTSVRRLDREATW